MIIILNPLSPNPTTLSNVEDIDLKQLDTFKYGEKVYEVREIKQRELVDTVAGATWVPKTILATEMP